MSGHLCFPHNNHLIFRETIPTSLSTWSISLIMIWGKRETLTSVRVMTALAWLQPATDLRRSTPFRPILTMTNKTSLQASKLCYFCPILTMTNNTTLQASKATYARSKLWRVTHCSDWPAQSRATNISKHPNNHIIEGRCLEMYFRLIVLTSYFQKCVSCLIISSTFWAYPDHDFPHFKLLVMLVLKQSLKQWNINNATEGNTHTTIIIWRSVPTSPDLLIKCQPSSWFLYTRLKSQTRVSFWFVTTFALISSCAPFVNRKIAKSARIVGFCTLKSILLMNWSV